MTSAGDNGRSDLIRGVRLRRPLLTALFVLAALAIALASGAPTTRLLHPQFTWPFIAAWLAMAAGVGVRIWGAGNLRKGKEITDAGIYRMVRHPLYTGSLLVFLAYFLAVGDPLAGLLLFASMIGLVYYPTMIDEERVLSRQYPAQFTPAYQARPRLLPDPRRLGEALRTDRFSWSASRANLGTRSAWVLVFLPLFTELLAWLRSVR